MIKTKPFLYARATWIVAWIAFAICFMGYSNACAKDLGEEIWNAFFKTGNIDNALAAFKEAAAEDESDALAHAGIGLLASSRVSESDRFIHLLDALEAGLSKSEAAFYLYEAADALSDRPDYETAVERLDTILMDNNPAEHIHDAILFVRARCLQRLGRWEEAEKAFSQLGFITRFWYCGPFDNAEKSGHKKIFEPEKKLDLQAKYKGRRQTVTWRPVPIDPYNGYIELHALVTPSLESTTYLAASIQSKESQWCRIQLGHAGALKVWLNGDWIADVDRYHEPVPDQVILDARLQEGNNTLLIKISADEGGKYGLFTRILPDKEGTIEIVDPRAIESLPDLTAHTPKPDQTETSNPDFEPIPLRQLRALGEAPGSKPVLHLFYTLLLQRMEVADDNDHSANTMLSQLNRMLPDNPFLLRLLGESEKDDNRRRLAFAKALEKDPNDLASFVHLLTYYQHSPYATKGFELIREWEKNNETPVSVRMQEAQMLKDEGLSEAAIKILNSRLDDLGPDEKKFLYESRQSFMTDQEKMEWLREALKEEPYESSLLNHLIELVLRRGLDEELPSLLEHERRIDPFSNAGLYQSALNHLGKGDYQTALQYLNKILAMNPSEFEARRNAAIAYHGLGNDAEAVASIQAALTVQPSHPWCQDYLEFLQPKEENYAAPYLKDWREIEIPETLDLSKANYVTLLDQRIVKAHKNGNSSETVQTVCKVLTDTGVRFKQVDGVYYEGDSEEVRILRARVWKPDGSYFDAPAPEHRNASSGGGGSERVYEDYNVAIIRFPALEKGSVVELAYEKKQKKENIYADYFGDQFYAGDQYFEPSVLSEYVLITPKSRDFYWKFIESNYPESVPMDHVSIPQEPTIRETGNERVYSWTFSHLPRLPREPQMPPPSETLPYLKVSTFKTWSDMTKWYWNLIREQIQPGTVVKQQLKRVLTEYRLKQGYSVEHPLSEWDIVQAVNAFINTEIRYLGLEFGIYGYKPRKVDEICNARYGDCKDKASLAVSMLNEAGVDANIVVLRTRHRGEIDYELPMLGIFNHAIYFVPGVGSDGRWIDGTATFFSAKELPSMDAGANSLIVKPGGEYEFKRIPHTEAKDNGLVTTSEFTLNESGAATGYRTTDYIGLYNPNIRRTLENPAKAKELIEQTLVSHYPGAEVHQFDISDMEDYSIPVTLSNRFRIPQFGVKEAERLVIPSTLFKEDLSLTYAQLSEREYDMILNFPEMQKNITTLTLPATYTQVKTPPDRDLTSPFGHYTRKSEWKDGHVTINEAILFEPVRVPKDQYQEFREFCRLVDHYQDEKIYASPES